MILGGEAVSYERGTPIWRHITFAASEALGERRMCGRGGLWVVRIVGDDGELRPWHCIYVYSIESRLIITVRYDINVAPQETQGGARGRASPVSARATLLRGQQLPPPATYGMTSGQP